MSQNTRNLIMLGTALLVVYLLTRNRAAPFLLPPYPTNTDPKCTYCPPAPAPAPWS